jgi:beta-lactamase regulating signal transducer with metallopeptidase domain
MNALEYILRFPWTEPLGRTLLHFLWQGALLGIVAGALLRLARRRSPALRHAIAVGALMTCAVLPASTFMVLARPWQTARPASIPKTTIRRVLVNAATPAPAVSGATNAVIAAPQRLAPLAPVRAQALPPTPAVAQSLLTSWRAPAARMAVIVWLVGVVLLGTRLAVGWMRVQFWRRGGRAVLTPAVTASFLVLARKLGVRPERVRLLFSRAAGLPGPVALGVFRPVVLLPARLLDRLPLAQIEALLAHELAHIRRHDYLWNLLASALEVMLFYHPVVWFLSRALRAAREECCDELAADVCPDRLVYARALATAAEWHVAASNSPAPEAARGPLLTRLRRLLGLALPAEPLVTGRNAGWVLALASVALMAAAVLYSGKLMAQTDDDNPDVPTLVHAGPHGTVVDEKGQPVPGARVLLYHAVSNWGLGNHVQEEVVAGTDGGFSFSQPVRFKNPDAVRSLPEYTVFALEPGHAMAWSAVLPETPEDHVYKLTLTRPKPQTFEVVDKAGQPIEGAVLWLRYAGQQMDKPPLFPENLILPEDIGVCRALTDASGRATLNDLPDTQISVAASKTGCEDEMSCTTPREGVPRFTLKPAGTLEGRVTDPLGRPVPGATVALYPKFRFHVYFLAKTDADGRYRVENIWCDRDAHPENRNWGKYDVSIRHPLLTASEREVTFSTGQTITGFDIAAVPGTEVSGRLLDPQTKLPVVGATIIVDSPSGRQTFCTGAGGNFRGRVMPGTISAFFASPPHDGWVDAEGTLAGLPSSVRTQISGEKFVCDLYLPGPLGQLGVVHGKVRLADGKPAPFCRVSPIMATGRLQTGNWTGNQLRGANTDGQGNFTLTEVPIGPAFTLNARTGDDSAAGTLAGKLQTATLDLSTPIVLQPTAAGGEFLLTDVTGKPRPNLNVDVAPMVDGQGLWSQNQRLKSDATGILRVPHVIPATRYCLTMVDGDGVTRVMNVFDAPAAAAGPPSRRTLTIDQHGLVRLLGADGQATALKRIVHFEALTRLNGRITTWQNAVPIEGRIGADALVSWRNLAGQRGDTARFLVETDDGNFVRAEGLLPLDGSNVIVVSPTETIRPETVPDPTIADVTADNIVGRVVTPEGEPVAGALIKLPGLDFEEEKTPPIVSAPDGVFRVAVPDPRRLRYLTIAKESWATAFLTDMPIGQGFRVVLHRDTRVRGTVGGGNPGTVAILFKKNKFTQREDSLDYEVRDLDLRVTTDTHGLYDLPIEPGRWRWEASSADGRFASGEANVEPGKIVDLGAALQPGNEVTFELMDCQSGKAIPGVEVAVYEQRPDLAYAARPGSTKTSDAAGRIQWENLPPGKKQFGSPGMQGGFPGPNQPLYTRWWREDEPLDWRRVDYAKAPPTGNKGADWIPLAVQENMPPIRILMERGVKVAGRVLAPDGTAAANITVHPVALNDFSLDGFFLRTDQEGKFVGCLPAGNGIPYWLCAYTPPDLGSSPGANAVSEPFNSKPGDELTFQLALTKGGWFTGRLLLADGKPAAGFKVTATNSDGLDSRFADRIATASADGNFRLGPMRQGKYQIRPGTGQGAPLGQLPGAAENAGNIDADGETRDLGDIALPAGAKLQN